MLDSPAAARFVTEPASSRFHQAFMGAPRFPAEAARELGVSVGAVLYRIEQMLALDLIRLVRTVPRSGRPMRAYRTTSDDLFAPLDLTAASSLGALFRESRLPSEDDLRRAIEQAWLRVSHEQHWGTHIYLSGGSANRDFVPLTLAEGDTFWDATLADRSPAVWDQIATVRLSRARAKRLQRDLAALLSEYPSDERGSE